MSEDVQNNPFLSMLQRLFLENSVIVVTIIAIMVIGSAGIILVNYTTKEDEQQKNINQESVIFAGVGVAITLIVSFFAFWVMFCPVYNPSREFEAINSKIRLKAIAVFVLCIFAIFPSVDIFIKRYIKPEDKHKDITMTEAVLVIGSSVVSILIVIYTMVNAFLYNPNLQQQYYR